MFVCSCHAWSRGALPSGHTSLRRRFGTQIDVPMWLTLIQMGQHHIEYRDHDHEFLTVSYDHVDSYFDRRLVISVPSCPILISPLIHIYKRIVFISINCPGKRFFSYLSAWQLTKVPVNPMCQSDHDLHRTQPRLP